VSVDPAALPPPPGPPPQPTRRSRTTVLALFAGAIAGSIVLALVLTLLSSSPDPNASCVYPSPCGPPRQRAELVSLTPWESQLGYSLRYDAQFWTVAADEPTGLTLALLGRDDVALHVVGSTGTTPQAALDAYVADLTARVPDLTEDGRAFRLVLGPHVGFHDGVGASYSGHVGTPQGPGPIVTMSAMAASVGGVTVVVSMEMTGDHWIQVDQGHWPGEDAFSAADSVINTVRWGDET
jgi:hypothetical protein